MDTALKIAVAGKDCRNDQSILFDGTAHRFGERPRIADAGRAAIADDVKTERLQVRQQPGLSQIPGDYLGTGRQTRLDMAWHIETKLDCFARE